MEVDGKNGNWKYVVRKWKYVIATVYIYKMVIP